MLILERVGSKYLLCIGCGALAKVYSSKGDTQKSLEYTRRCLELASKGNYIQIFLS